MNHEDVSREICAFCKPSSSLVKLTRDFPSFGGRDHRTLRTCFVLELGGTL